MTVLLGTCGLILAGAGTWFGYRSAREAVAPAVHQGDPTRTAIDAARPLHQRTAVRRALRSVVGAVLWLVLAMYGLFLLSTALAVEGYA